MKSIFISGPIRAETPRLVHANIERAIAAWWEFTLAGFAVHCPHLEPMWATWAFVERPELTEIILAADKNRIESCDILHALPGWRHSEGSKEEHIHAMKCGKRIYLNHTVEAVIEAEKLIPEIAA